LKIALSYRKQGVLGNLILVVFLCSCVEPIEFKVPPPEEQTVVEGMITTEPGPYLVKLSRARGLSSDFEAPIPIEGARIVLFDDEGNTEDFMESQPGTYLTSGVIRGRVGHSYHIRIETADGKVFESEPDQIRPVGEIDDIRFGYEARTTPVGEYEVAADVFNVYVDAYATDDPDNYIRWRFTGTYEVLTYPELHMTKIPSYTPFKDPYPCSGYIVVEFVPGGKLEKIADCTCCTCWARQYESKPQLSDTQLVSDGQFNNIKVGEVPINSATFYDKYLIEVEQMSLTRQAFDYFKLIRSQKDGASSLFQPPSGEIRGNIKAVGSNEAVVGLFWASAVSKASKFITREDVPYPVVPITFSTTPCYDYYPNSTTDRPALWE
jgi:hypothetical protein